MELNKIYNMDCMEGMKEIPDKYFELAIVDPPYGQFNDDKRGHQGGGHAKKYGYGKWDIAPTNNYFDELFRISKNQIIWGGNYFNLPPTRCFLIWRKLTISENFTMAMCEYAWSSFLGNAKWIEIAPQDRSRFHPTQKPVALYKGFINQGNDIEGCSYMLYALPCRMIRDFKDYFMAMSRQRLGLRYIHGAKVCEICYEKIRRG